MTETPESPNTPESTTTTPPPPMTDDGLSVNGSANTGDIHAREATIIGSFVNNLLPDASKPITFSVESASQIDAEQTDMLDAVFVANEDWIRALVADLEKHRVLLLTGERGTGKATLAAHLSTLVARRANLRANTLKVEPLARAVSIDVHAVVDNVEDFGRRATIFLDVFSRHNRQLYDFFDGTARVGWEGIAETLRANSAFLLFTAETQDIEKFRQLHTCLECRVVPPLTRDLVARGTDRRLQWLEKKKLATAAHVQAAAAHRSRLIDELRSLQRVAQFLDLFATGDPDVDAALRLFNDVGGHWFAKDLAADVDAWCFALTLALAHSAREASGVGWFEFETIRRAITDRVKNDTELFPRRRRPESQELETDEHTTGQSLSDDRLLTRCRAEIGRDASRLGDAVRFRDETYATLIWQHALTHNRRVLTMLVPALRTLAEEAGDYGVRALAAQMIGRVGELDPLSISIPIARRDWPRSDRQRPLVGSLLQGMLASDNERYKQTAMSAIDALIGDGAGDERAESDGLLTAISAYSQLGEDVPELAMDRLGVIAVEKLAPVMADLNEIGRVSDIVNRGLARTPSKQTAEDLLIHRFRLARFARELRGRRAAAVMATMQAVVYLCLCGDAVEVLKAMRVWISKGGSPAGALVALLFLHGGIAEQLESVAANMRSLTGGHPISPIVYSLASRSDAVEQLAGFLADVHAAVNAAYSLPHALQQNLRDSLDECLTTWARSSAVVGIYRDAVAELFVALTNIRNGAMRADIYTLFSTSPFNDEASLREFAAEVRRRRLQRAGGMS
ncbi:MAG TPA: hypothetical protein VEO54_26295 [Thermoanaerobaculia bacterium]|nr:hypothetical protein [Thermoanaerobaculia bacterium]